MIPCHWAAALSGLWATLGPILICMVPAVPMLILCGKKPEKSEASEAEGSEYGGSQAQSEGQGGESQGGESQGGASQGGASQGGASQGGSQSNAAPRTQERSGGPVKGREMGADTGKSLIQRFAREQGTQLKEKDMEPSQAGTVRTQAVSGASQHAGSTRSRGRSSKKSATSNRVLMTQKSVTVDSAGMDKQFVVMFTVGNILTKMAENGTLASAFGKDGAKWLQPFLENFFSLMLNPCFYNDIMSRPPGPMPKNLGEVEGFKEKDYDESLHGMQKAIDNREIHEEETIKVAYKVQESWKDKKFMSIEDIKETLIRFGFAMSIPWDQLKKCINEFVDEGVLARDDANNLLAMLEGKKDAEGRVGLQNMYQVLQGVQDTQPGANKTAKSSKLDKTKMSMRSEANLDPEVLEAIGKLHALLARDLHAQEAKDQQKSLAQGPGASVRSKAVTLDRGPGKEGEGKYATLVEGLLKDKTVNQDPEKQAAMNTLKDAVKNNRDLNIEEIEMIMRVLAKDLYVDKAYIDKMSDKLVKKGIVDQEGRAAIDRQCATKFAMAESRATSVNMMGKGIPLLEVHQIIAANTVANRKVANIMFGGEKTSAITTMKPLSTAATSGTSGTPASGASGQPPSSAHSASGKLAASVYGGPGGASAQASVVEGSQAGGGSMHTAASASSKTGSVASSKMVTANTITATITGTREPIPASAASAAPSAAASSKHSSAASAASKGGSEAPGTHASSTLPKSSAPSHAASEGAGTQSMGTQLRNNLNAGTVYVGGSVAQTTEAQKSMLPRSQAAASEAGKSNASAAQKTAGSVSAHPSGTAPTSFGVARTQAAGSIAGGPSTGGHTASQKGQPSQGAHPSQGGQSQGGQPSQGGKPSQGGLPSQGGQPSQGGKPSQGGIPSQGGQPSMGGKPSQGGQASQGGKSHTSSHPLGVPLPSVGGGSAAVGHGGTNSQGGIIQSGSFKAPASLAKYPGHEDNSKFLDSNLSGQAKKVMHRESKSLVQPGSVQSKNRSQALPTK